MSSAEQISHIPERYAAVQSLMHNAIQSSQRDPDDIRLLAVSKGHNTDAIRTCHRQGQVWFGENYAQELSQKAEELADLHVNWSFIGRIQSNKIPSIVKHAHEIQGLADLKHGQLIARHAVMTAKTPFPVWILVNAGEESSKAGVPLDHATSFAKSLESECPVLDIQGIMAIPPKDLSLENGQIPPLYHQLAEVARTIGAGQLSLGMTNDLGKAIGAGSNCVRVGTAIFGDRPPKT